MIRASELTVTWQRSTRSQNGADNCVEIAHLTPIWRRSSRSSGGSANCVEVASLIDATAVRDSKDPDGPALVFGAAAFGGFLDALKAGRLRG
ncbi:DUF397 domain-containing protein [Saccharopolyspora sp. 5N102]|uniref:DUF397 domain-containing protein n=1 Tax=Saccharopolyspora sp. 5N102 TaxID=3375155 RepID=UPI0037A781A5